MTILYKYYSGPEMPNTDLCHMSSVNDVWDVDVMDLPVNLGASEMKKFPILK